MRKNDRPLRIDGAVYPDDAYEAGLSVTRDFPYEKRSKAFADIPRKVASVCVLYMAGFKKFEICRLMNTTVPTINKYLKRGAREYPNVAEYLD